jgi:HlyD family secretion protein
MAPKSLYPLIVFAVALGAVSACSRTESAQAAARTDVPRPVSVDLVRQDAVHRAVEVVGTLAADSEVTVSAEAEGHVSRLLADLGDRVTAGQTLVELDRERSEYMLDQQRAALARALAKYGAADAKHLPAIEQTPDVQKAQAELVQAKQSHERAVELQKRELIPTQTLDDAEATLRSKQAAYDSSLQNAKNLRADIDGSSASMKLADRQLRDANIRAPFDGYVQKRMVNVGEYVKTQTPVMSVVRINPLKATAEIPEKMAPWITAGQAVALQVDAFPGRTIVGKMARISPAVNPGTRAFPFEALVPNGDGVLKPGTFARIHIESAKIDRVLTVPTSAIQYRYGTNRVFVINGDRVVARELRLGDHVGDRVEITGDLGPGDRVATSDIERLGDGVRVSIQTPSKKS